MDRDERMCENLMYGEGDGELKNGGVGILVKYFANASLKSTLS